MAHCESQLQMRIVSIVVFINIKECYNFVIVVLLFLVPLSPIAIHNIIPPLTSNASTEGRHIPQPPTAQVRLSIQLFVFKLSDLFDQTLRFSTKTSNCFTNC